MSKAFTSITFFHSDDCEKQAVAPIADEARQRGFNVRFSSDLSERVEIGVYCQHACKPNADFSIIMLHDLAQRHDIWPEFWKTEPWHHFDMGLVPGQAWSERWASQAASVQAWPKLGVFNVGWPKADLVYRDRERFAEEAQKLRESLGLIHKHTILYAPSWENDGKQDDFVRALIDLPVNLLLKQAPWAPEYTGVWNNIRAMDNLHRGIAENVHIVDPRVSIMYCIGLADALVSEESSVLIEAALLDVPAISVTDWMIPDRTPPRPACVPFDHVMKTTRAQLRGTIEALLKDPEAARQSARTLRDFHFSHFGESARRAMDLLEAALQKKPLPQPHLPAPAGLADLRPAPEKRKLADFVRDRVSGVWTAGAQTHFGYSDGDGTEQKIGHIVANSNDVSVFSPELVSQIDDWPSEYHFSPRRANLFRWLDGLGSDVKVLELGCGCGAITKTLAESGCQIDAVEGSPRRAGIAAQRVREHPNARIFHSNFQNIDFEPQYDIVTLIGVLEYSPVYLNAEDPFIAGLKMAASALKPGGMLVFAIENKVGLKYFAGISEDHCAKPYYGVENRYDVHDATTYGKRQLTRRLKKAGFAQVDFFYPYPDYKLPEVIFSERAVQNEAFNTGDLISHLENRDYFNAGKTQFNLPLTWETIGDEGLVGELANSFLIFARPEPGERFARPGLLAQKFTDSRAPAYNCVTSFIEDGAGGIDVVKTPMVPESKRQDQRIDIRQVLTNERYVSGRNLGGLIKRAMIKGKLPRAYRLLQLWLATLRNEAVDGLLPPEWLDAIPANMILDDDGQCHFIDREWHYSQPLPLDLLIYRSLVVIALELGEVFHPQNFDTRIKALCEVLDVPYSAEQMSRISQLNAQSGHVHFDGGLWKADRYRSQLQVGGPSSQVCYSEWITSRQVAVGLDVVQARIDSWPLPPRIAVVVIDTGQAAEQLQHSLSRLQDQLYPPAATWVISNAVAPEQTEDMHWVAAGQHWQTSLNANMGNIEADWIYLLHAGDQLDRFALLLLADAIISKPDILSCYSDENMRDNDLYHSPLFKPDFSLDLLRSYPYVGRTLAFNLERTIELGGFNERYGELAPHDVMLRMVESVGLNVIGHISEVLVHTGQTFGKWLSLPEVVGHSPAMVAAHLERLEQPHEILEGALPLINRVRYQHSAQPLVSILVPTKDQLPVLQRCIESLIEKTSYANYELLIIDNNSETPEAKGWLQGLEDLGSEQIRVLRYPKPFNFSAINNFAAQQARGEYLVLLNNDTAIIQADWLENLLNHAQRAEVGIVGAKLLYPDGTLQHGGVVLGLRGPADHPFLGEAGDAPGYMHRLLVDQNYTAVTAACLIIRKSLYDEVGGMDEEDFKVSYNDVDLCIKARYAGYLTVWTPYALLMHEGSVSQKSVDPASQEAKRKRFQGEQDAMYKKWLPLLARDPAYNRNLNLDKTGFELDLGRLELWQPFSQPLLPRVLCHPADRSGCGHYRVRQPFLSMQRAGLVEGGLSEHLLLPVEMERFEADSVILQRQVTDAQLDTIADMKAFSGAFKVYELDDYLPNLPLKSVHRADMPKDILRSLRRALGMVDRFVVSTEPLAEAFGDIHPDIRVVRNRLPTDWWGTLQSQRRVGRKPRVGWAGGVGHTGDLELIADVVRDLADEVEWVFFGLCPDKLKPYVHEFHRGVPIDRYPALLASLDLDLALAPLEQNQFNDCKSNLRLLEYGVLGFPVICSDVVCYRDGLPVTRVKNRYKDWMDAVRMHLADLDATAKAGDELQQVIRRDWMLEGVNLQNWAKAWLPD